MATQNNDVLGYITCEAGGRASVHQTKRGKGRYLYTRCDCCGCDQRNGSAFQTRLYNHTQWLGEKPIAPPNYKGADELKKEPVVQPKEPSNDAGSGDDWQPNKEPVVQPENGGGGKPKGGFFVSLMVSLLIGGVAIAIGRGR